MTEPDYLADTRRWLDRAVIGLNLCPFAKAVVAKEQVRFVLSDATTPEALLAELGEELALLRDTDPATTDTTLIVHPFVLQDFLDYNDFLDRAEDALDAHGYAGTLQIASFHPNYQFAGTAPDDPGNATNRSPYPTLHLLREEGVARAAEAFPEAEAIYERNIETMERLGNAGWAALRQACREDAWRAVEGGAD